MATVRKAVITAAGRGTRQYPATSVVQKEMLPLVDRDGLTKPLIQIIAEEALDAGITEICIVVSPGDEEFFRQYFRALRKDLLPAFAGKEWALKESENLAQIEKALTFVVQKTPEGYGHSVYQAREFVGDEPFLLLLGDHIYISPSQNRCARQLVDAYHYSQAEALSSVKPTPASLLHRFGTLKGVPLDESARLFRAVAIKEKPSVEYARQYLATPGLPAEHYLCHFGIHVFPPLIFDCLERHIRDNIRDNGEIQLTSAQEAMRSLLLRYFCYEVSGERYDAGIPFGLMEAQLALALAGVHRQEIIESLARLLTQQLITIKRQ
jgi:UTP--glucose-1-phosphate uridylyltransferase